MNGDYRSSCPHCGGQLDLLDKGGEHAPWLCATCHLAFFHAELTDEARAHWRPAYRDFGFGDHVAVIEAGRAAELHEQMRRA